MVDIKTNAGCRKTQFCDLPTCFAQKTQGFALRQPAEKLLIVSARFFGIPLFCFYALAEGIRKVLSQGRPPTCAPPCDTWPVQLFLAWHG